MLYLTPEEKRQRLISRSIIAFMKSDEAWFKDVANRIEADLQRNPEKKAKILLKWCIDCEKLFAPTVKDEILTRYTHDDSDSKKSD